MKWIKKKWYWFIGMLIPMAFGASLLIPTTDLDLKEAKVIGISYLAEFNGEPIEITEQEYRNIGKLLKHNDIVWDGVAYETPKYNTASGRLEAGYFFIDGEYVAVKLQGEPEAFIKLTELNEKGVVKKGKIYSVDTTEIKELIQKDEI